MTSGSLEKPTERCVQGPASAASYGRGTSHIYRNFDSAYSYVATASGFDFRYDDYGNPHHVAAAYGPDVGSSCRVQTAASGHRNQAGSWCSSSSQFRTNCGTTIAQRTNPFAKLYEFPNNALSPLCYPCDASLSATH
uniref:Uncharacterized protein n=1 Tax=Romanomermis culicivorax TaxID=13658 RepID=A0A915KAP8_ROMCU